jgi:hypothetical protein
MEKRRPRISATSVIIKKLPKVNNRPWGENSSNLVTLANMKIVSFAVNKLLFSQTSDLL